MIIGISGKIGSGKDLTGRILQIILNNPQLNDEGVMTFLNKEITDNSNWQIKKFADKLKDIVCILIGCTREQLEDREFKEKELGEEWWKWKIDVLRGRANSPYPKQYILPYIDITGTDHKIILDRTVDIVCKTEVIKMTPRLLLQLLGTECGREILHPNIWVNSVFSDYKAYIKDYPHLIKSNGKNLIEGNRYSMGKAILPNWIITDVRFPNELEAVKKRGGITLRINRKPWINVDEYEAVTGKKVERVEEHESEKALDNAEFDYTIDNDGTINDLIEKVRKFIAEKLQ